MTAPMIDTPLSRATSRLTHCPDRYSQKTLHPVTPISKAKIVKRLRNRPYWALNRSSTVQFVIFHGFNRLQSSLLVLAPHVAGDGPVEG